MNIVLLLAGGVGKRSGLDIPKQFIPVDNIPIIVYTLRVFQRSKMIDAICVVAHSEWINKVWEYSRLYGISKVKWVVSGGETGLESVKNGVESLNNNSEDDLVLIHDSVRPFLTQKAIDDNIKVASEYGVAVTSVPCVETLVKVRENGRADTQISRDGLMRVMTPQTFRLRILRDLFRNTDIRNSIFPSTFALYMSKGNPVYCSYGSERNIKITYPEDVVYFKSLFEK